jgi:folate-dependent phosphoribosylglycinamide formyltransferase PurN
MRVVVLSSSVYSESACAMAARLAQLGHVPVGALALRTVHAATLLRKIGQWGLRGSAQYARQKLVSRSRELQSLRNPHLSPVLQHGGEKFRSLRDVAASYHFPVTLCSDQNAPASIRRLKEWSPDLILFAGGNILRKPLLEIPCLGVLNAHLGLLPEVRGMSSPEWSLLTGIAPGVTIHYVDLGIDTGPILQRFEFADAASCKSLEDLRNRLIAFGVEKMADVVTAIAQREIVASPQSKFAGDDRRRDNQFFVVHEWLQARAAERLVAKNAAKPAEATHA